MAHPSAWPLAERLLAALPKEHPSSALPPASLEPALQELLRRADISKYKNVDTGGFVAHLAGLLPAEEPLAILGALHAQDLGLAWACLAGDDGALAELNRRCLTEAQNALRGMGLALHTAADLTQQTLERLLTARPGETPRLALFRGQSQLSLFVRATAVRLATEELRRRHRRDALWQQHGGLQAELERDPETNYIQENMRAPFVAALHAAIEALSPRERNVLRAHTLLGESIDVIARRYHVHRATAARWLERIRLGLREEVAQRLQQTLGASPQSVQSLIGVAHRGFDASLRRVLATTQTENDGA
jgi:RNA polymerase sigma-70 factor (ECF subfamily)